MADLNDMSKPDLVSNYSTEVLQTIKGHISRLWSGDYTGMGGLVTNMRRWIDLGSGDARLVKRNADGSETTIFDSSTKATKTYVDSQISGEATARSSAVSNEASSRDSAISSAIYSEVSSRNSAVSSAISTEVINRNAAIAVEANARVLAMASVTQKGIGFGGTVWVNVKPNRAGHVWYMNSRSYPIAISISRDGFDVGTGAVIYIDGYFPVANDESGYIDGRPRTSMFAIIPPAVSYMLYGSFTNWIELY